MHFLAMIRPQTLVITSAIIFGVALVANRFVSKKFNRIRGRLLKDPE